MKTNMKSILWGTINSVTLMFSLLVMIGCSKDNDDNDDDNGLVSYDLSALTIDSDGNLGGTVTITLWGKPVADETITLSYRTYGGNGTATSTDIVVGKSNSSGQVTVSASVDKTPRVIHFTTDNYATHREITLGTVPVGFLTGQASALMDLDEARGFCAFHGGKLPLINNTKEYPWDVYVIAMQTNNYPTADGFGHLFDAWPADVPVAFPPHIEVSYWTDTKDTDYDDMWLISPAYNDETKVLYSSPGANFAGQKYAVICMP